MVLEYKVNIQNEIYFFMLPTKYSETKKYKNSIYNNIKNIKANLISFLQDLYHKSTNLKIYFKRTKQIE